MCSVPPRNFELHLHHIVIRRHARISAFPESPRNALASQMALFCSVHGTSSPTNFSPSVSCWPQRARTQGRASAFGVPAVVEFSRRSLVCRYLRGLARFDVDNSRVGTPSAHRIQGSRVSRRVSPARTAVVIWLVESCLYFIANRGNDALLWEAAQHCKPPAVVCVSQSRRRRWVVSFCITSLDALMLSLVRLWFGKRPG